MAACRALCVRKMLALPRYQAGILGITKRYAADISIWKPGPRPRTKEEIELAAAKYNMIPEDYRFYDEDECFGDYPELQPISYKARDPYFDWDDEFMRQVYGEPVVMGAEYHQGPGKLPTDEIEETGKIKQAFAIWTPLFVLYLIMYFSEKYDIYVCTPEKPKQFPGADKVHYDFQPV
ncbi:NADH:ubiquinone oxidoreductase subunit ASHI [Brevipalpus obovatus]|uniref:NADH:ubiquinone oxidoreductase subunit ASHI n=1 Tax=Brevipalpus obovatus TaxID=246614 RepID=UPI003D9E5CA4